MQEKISPHWQEFFSKNKIKFHIFAEQPAKINGLLVIFPSSPIPVTNC
jgi:hypothetical protein